MTYGPDCTCTHAESNHNVRTRECMMPDCICKEFYSVKESNPEDHWAEPLDQMEFRCQRCNGPLPITNFSNYNNEHLFVYFWPCKCEKDL